MKILHTESSCGWGGQEIRILSEAEGMIGRGHELTLIAPREARIHGAALKRGLNVVALPIARKGIRGMLALRSWLKDRQPDVLNTHSSTDTWLSAIACATLPRPPAIVRTRHISARVPNDPFTRWLYLNATRHIVTTGEGLRAQLVRENGFPPERITSVPTGVDLNRFAPGERAAARRATGLPPERLLIGIVATLRSWKGHRYLIDAFAGLPADTGLVIVGDGPQRQNIESQIAALRLGERVWLPGNQEDVLPWLQSLDVFALPSYANEGVPQALVQAMLCGLPCVTTLAGSIGEVARDGVTAVVVGAEDAADLRRGLQAILADPKLRERLGSAAHLHCVGNFGKEAMLERMEGIFREAVNSIR